ncbi:NlpC/P60 family protein [Faecalicatena orotica]|uniref:NlpC/P60 family protein n=1 Tax=Faecalicatena orotica TaxID=1544 RepID=UPI003217E618
MKAKEYKRVLAAVLSAGMITVQAAPVLAADISGGQTAGQAQAEESGKAELPKQALTIDGTETMVDISEEVLAMLEDGSVYLDEETGYLLDKETKIKVDPVTGEREDEKEQGSTGSEGEPEKPEGSTPGDKDEGGKGDGSGSVEEGKGDGQNGSSSGDENQNQDGSVNEGGSTPDDSISPEDPAQSEKPSDAEGTEDKKEDDSKKQEAEDANKPSTNAALIAGQQIIRIPNVKKDFRLWTVARRYAFARTSVNVREEMTADARAVGSLNKDGLLYVLQEEKGGWLYVESGTVRGFVKADEVLRGDDAQKLLKEFQNQAKEKAEKEKKEYTGIETVVTLAKELVPQGENEAFLHTHATVNRTVVDKKYALTTIGLLNVREGKGMNSRIVGTLKADSLCYILADENEEWVYVESGDVRGFVNKRYLKTGKDVDRQIEKSGEDSFPTASEIIEPENNQACYYTLTSVKSGVPGAEVRESLVEYASQFIGNPYIWGGTSLTEGADCSGFVQSIYKQYGYDLPRVAEDQAQYGTKIPVGDAKPGDLIFYAKDGHIHHVVIYAGDSRTVEAMGTDYGIVQGSVDKNEAVWATRVLDDSSYAYAGSIGEVNATDDMYGEDLGNFELTYYCSCEICCDVETGITATGTPVVEGRTIAVDPDVIPYGTKVIIGGHVFTAEDCGGAIKGKHIDIYVNDHERALSMGVNQAQVHLVK